MSTVLLDQPAPGVARLSLNRPHVLNAINRELLSDLAAAIEAVDGDEAVRSVILTGAGRAFSAGFDLKAEAEEGSLAVAEWAHRFTEDWQVFLGIWRSPKPFVASVRGYNLGGALELSLLCDVTLAAEGTRFGLPEIRHGSGPGAAMVPWLTGMKAAKYLLLTGDIVDADEAWRLGLVTSVVPDADLDARAVAMAEKLALIPPDAMRLNKLAVNRTYERLGMLTAIADNYMISAVVNGTPSYQDGEKQRQQMNFREFVRERDRPFSADGPP